ncbi:rhomboid family intramembrane serine protease [Lactococcus hodotermopsidis]|uniref:Rhomboid family intramembrane serine protease n=1 Tax=Pseudolactococcus hodotermopsidis TaxID=2709157 RepID=A0A6A0BD47_9LACT|nr:rhomboid family intramembrane serine protease [Lactococcus hodotermopsidis]GFH42301.1 rhomboid family intramembrane serine protease [Lactococcus hodotermopsidis]
MKTNYNFRVDFNKHRATYVLGALTLGVWLSQLVAHGSQVSTPINLFNSGALFGPDIVEHPTHLWRLVTPIFVHISWSHFVLNFFSLVFIGRQIEEVFGSKQFFAIYLLSGIYGNILTFFIKPETISAGASTSLFGIFGAMAMLGFLTKNPSFQVVGRQFAAMILVNLAINIFQTGVGITGHIGGALGGILLAAPLAPKIFQKKIDSSEKLIFLSIFIVTAILMILLAMI